MKFKFLLISLSTILIISGCIKKSPRQQFFQQLAQNDEINIGLYGFYGEEVLIVVMDILGNIYYEKAVVIENNNTITIVNSQLSIGTYLIVGSTKQDLYKRKLIIK